MQTTPFTCISSLVSADIFQMLLHADFKMHLKKLDFQYLPKKVMHIEPLLGAIYKISNKETVVAFQLTGFWRGFWINKKKAEKKELYIWYS